MEEKNYSPITLMKTSRTLPMSRDDEVGQYVSSTKIPGQQTPKKEIMFSW